MGPIGGAAEYEPGSRMLGGYLGCEHRGEPTISRFVQQPAQGIAGSHYRERSRETGVDQPPPNGRSEITTEIHYDPGIWEGQNGVRVRPPHRMHGPKGYMLEMRASANSLVLRRVAPSIRRWKS